MNMYYLRKIDKHGDRALYKHNKFDGFYRGYFNGIKGTYYNMPIFMTESREEIADIQKQLYDFCGELFDIYDENGIVADFATVEIDQLKGN